MAQGLIAIDWRAIKKWSVLLTIVMLLWLLFPVAKCSMSAFRAEPLSEAVPHGEEKPEEPGFMSRMGTAISGCYKQTPLLGQESYKTYLLFGFAGLALLAGVIAYIEAGKARSYDK